MPTAKEFKKLAKRLTRKSANVLAKAVRAEQRKAEMIALGKTVIVTEVDGVKKYAFPPVPPTPPTPPRLQWLSGKTSKHGNPSKTRPGRKPEQIQAFAENASRTLATEIEKATSVPTVDGTPVVAAAA